MKTITIKVDVATDSQQDAESLAETFIAEGQRAVRDGYISTDGVTVSNWRVKSVKDTKVN